MKLAAFVALAYSVSPVAAQNHGGKLRQMRQTRKLNGSSKTAKSKGGKSSSSDVDDPVDPCPGVDLQDGYSCGQAPEIAGLWAGNEVFYLGNATDGVTNRYCTRALFNPARGQNFLNWNAAFLSCDENDDENYYYCDGDGSESCAVRSLERCWGGNWKHMLI